MRVWMVSSTYPSDARPHAGAFVRHQAEAIAARGHDVTVIELAPALRARKWALLARRRWAVDPAISVVRGIRAEVPGAPVPGFRSAGRREGRRVLEEIAQTEGLPDLIHLHFTQLPGLAGTSFAKPRGIPTVLTVHENEDWLRRELRVPVCRRAWRDAGALVRVSRKDSAQLQVFNPELHVIPNGFSPEHLARESPAEARVMLGLDAGARWAVCVASFIQRKRHDVLLRALAAVRATGMDLRLLLVGDGPARGAIDRLARELGLGAALKFAGRLSNADLARAYAAADVCCLSSDAEGNPTVMFEAFGAGRPYVGTDVGGASDVIADVGHGRLVPPDDPKAFAEALLEVLRQPPPPLERIRRDAAAYSWSAIAGRLEEVYGLVRSRAGSAAQD